MAAESFKIQGGRLTDPDQDDALATELYEYGFPTASNSGGVITIDNTELAGTDALLKFKHLIRFCEAVGASLHYTESA